MSIGTICVQDLLRWVYAFQHIILFHYFQNRSLQQTMGQCASFKENQKLSSNSPTAKNHYKIDDFRLLQVVGKGGFSTVWKAEEKKSGKLYALKVMSKAKVIAKKSVKAVMLERMILTRLMERGAQSVVNMLASFQDDNNLYILMDYLQGQSLRHHLNLGINLSNSQIQSFIYSLLKALQQLYTFKLVHRDIKPQNIIFDKDGRPFLTDFGIASYLQKDLSDSNSGTLGYMSPQVMQSQTHSFTADYYAVGVIAYQLFFKKRPFTTTIRDELFRSIIKTDVNTQNFPELNQLPSEASDFIIKLLQRRPRRRLGHANGIYELLEHPWFNSLTSDSSDQIQFNYIKFPLSNPQNNSSIVLQQESVESLGSQTNERQIEKILHRDHVQDMFRSFNSETKIEAMKRRRKMSELTELVTMTYSLKKALTTAK